MQLIVCLGFSFGKLCKNMEKLLFFRGATAGLGKYHTDSYGRMGSIGLIVPVIFH